MDALDLLNQAGIRYKRRGNEIEADIDGSGHLSYKINAKTGLWFCTTGGQGNIDALARIIRERTGTGKSYHPPAIIDTDSLRANAATERAVKAKRAWLGAIRWHSLSPGHRQAFAAYMASRGFEPGDYNQLLDAGLIRFSLIDKIWEHDADFCAVYPVFEDIETDEDGAAIINGDSLRAVQKLYLKIDGTRGRFALGGEVQSGSKQTIGAKQGGYCFIPAKNNSKDVAIAEGFETALAYHAATGGGCIVAYDANNLAPVAAKIAPKLNDDAALLFLVDRDVSETGQKAAANAIVDLRAQGYRASYCAPPAIVKGGSKGADWQDALVEHGRHAMTALFAAALKLGEKESAIYMPHNIGRIFHCAQEGFATAEEARKAAAEFFDAEQLTRSMLLQVPPGIGKSSAIAKFMAKENYYRIAVISPQKAFIKDFEAIKEVARLHGRASYMNAEAPMESHCMKYGDVTKLGDRNHTIASTLCHACEHGIAYMAVKKKDEWGENPEEEIKFFKKARARYRLSREDIELAIPCTYLEHVDKIKGERAITAVAQSYSKDFDDRVIIIDEEPKLVKNIRITHEDMLEWLRNIEAIMHHKNTKRSVKAIIGSEDAEDRSSGRSLDIMINIAAEAIIGLKDKLNDISTHHPTGTYNIAEFEGDLSPALARLASLAGIVNQDSGTGFWEKPFVRRGKVLEAPMRALTAIAWSCLHGAGLVQDGALVVHHPSAVGARILGAGDPPVYIADATPSPELKAVFDRQFERKTVKVNQHWVRIARKVKRFYGSSEFNQIGHDDARKYDNAIKRYTSLIRAELAINPDTVFIMHKEAAYEIGKALIPEGNIGYWGKDHRAHNNWEGKARMVIIGSFHAPPEDVRALYSAARAFALAGGAPEEDWPLWGGKMVNGLLIHEVKDAPPVQSYIPLPDNEQVRAWYLEKTKAETLQAIGRLRAVNYPERDIEVIIYGGVPLPGLDQEGFGSIMYAEDTHGRTLKQHNDLASDLSRLKGNLAIAALRDNGIPADKITAKAVNERAKQISTETVATLLGAEDEASLKYIESMAGKGVRKEIALEILRAMKHVNEHHTKAKIKIVYIDEHGEAEMTEGGKALTRLVMAHMGIGEASEDDYQTVGDKLQDGWSTSLPLLGDIIRSLNEHSLAGRLPVIGDLWRRALHAQV